MLLRGIYISEMRCKSASINSMFCLLRSILFCKDEGGFVVVCSGTLWWSQKGANWLQPLVKFAQHHFRVLLMCEDGDSARSGKECQEVLDEHNVPDTLH
jgi:hypothetical protein